MRSILIVLLLCIAACGVLFSALNGGSAVVDFYFFQVSSPLGVALMCALLAGWLLGGLVAWFGLVPRLRRELRAARRDRAAGAAPGDATDRA